MTRKLRIRVERTFNSHTVGDEMIVSETEDVKQLVHGKWFTVLAVEDEGKPAEPKPKAEKAEKPAAKKTSKKKGK